jgi:hypothetical protein
MVINNAKAMKWLYQSPFVLKFLLVMHLRANTAGDGHQKLYWSWITFTREQKAVPMI